MAENSFKQQVEQAKADIRSIVDEMAKADREIIGHLSNIREKFNGTFKITTPDGLTDLITKLDNTMSKLNNTLDQQTTNTGKLSAAKRTLKNLSSDEVVNQRALAKNADLQATASSKLVGAYERLNAQRKIAKNRLRDLLSEEKRNNAEIRKAQREYDKLTNRINIANRATSNFTKNSLGGMVRGFRNLFGAFGIVGGATLIASLTKDIFNLVKEVESLNFALKTVTSSQEEFIRVQLFLEDISERYGQNLITTTERYTKFLAAAKQSNLSLSATEQIFESVTKAAGVLGLKTDELSGVYLALEQMLSKGKVTTEELRRQLGERLPGAFGIMANAIGVTVEQLDKMLRKGEILSADALPKFAIALEEAYGIENINNVDTLVAAQNRLSNSWLLFVKNVEGGSGKISSVFKDVLNFVSQAIDKLTEFNKTFEDKMNEGTFAATRTSIEAITQEADKMNVPIKEAASNLIPRYNKILGEWREKLAQVNQEQQKSALNNAWNVLNGKWAEQEKTAKRAGEQIGLYTKSLEILKQVAETGVLPGSEPSGGGTPTPPEPSNKKLEARRGSIAFLEGYIKKLEEEQAKIATTEHAYDGYALAIDQAKENLRQLIAEFESFNQKGGKVDIVFDEINESDIRDAQKKILDIYKKAYDERVAKAKEINDEIQEYQSKKYREEAEKLRIRKEYFTKIFNEITETFADVFDLDTSKFEFLFDGLKNSVEDWAGASKELIGSVLDASLNRYEVELQEAQRARDLVLENDLATEKQKRIAREKFDKEERAIKTRAARAEKRATLIKIAADTAAGIVSALAQVPKFDFGISAGLLAGVIAATGAAQAAIVAAQPIPKFKDGHLSGTHSGKALINDAKRSDYKEVVERNNGQVEIYKDRNQMIEMKRGDKVHKSVDRFLTYHDIERDALGMSMSAHNEQLAMRNNDLVLISTISDMKHKFEEVTDKMEDLAKRPIENHNHITIEVPYDEYKQ